MDEITVEILQYHSEYILAVTGSDSYVDWPLFSQISDDLLGEVEETEKRLQQFRGIAQQHFLASMRKLKCLDIPDALKCVKYGKIPISGLRSIIHRFNIQGDKLKIHPKPYEMRREATTVMAVYSEEVKKVMEALENANRAMKFLMEKHNIPTYSTENAFYVIFYFYQNKLNRAANRLKSVIANQKLLSLYNYTKILDASIDVCCEQFVQMTQDYRYKSRYSLKYPIKYYRHFSENYFKIEKLLENAQNYLISKVGLPKDTIQKSKIVLIKEGKMENLIKLQTETRQDLKYRLGSKRHVTKYQAKQIIQYQITLLKNANAFKEYFVCLPKNEDAGYITSSLLTTILNDYVFQQYSVEEYDYVQALDDNIDSYLLTQLENAICQLLSDVGMVDESVRESLSQNQYIHR